MNYRNKKYKIIWSKSFIHDLDNIYNYIFYDLNEPFTARLLHSKIVSSLSSLKYFPNRCPKLFNSTNNKTYNIRKLIVDKYIILYKVIIDTRSSFFTSYLS